MKTTRQAFADELIRRGLTIGFFSHELAKIGVYVVGPKEVTSLVYISDESRFYPQINDDDVVVGGYYG